jgi:hypothetical protein
MQIHRSGPNCHKRAFSVWSCRCTSASWTRRAASEPLLGAAALDSVEATVTGTLATLIEVS